MTATDDLRSSPDGSRPGGAEQKSGVDDLHGEAASKLIEGQIAAHTEGISNVLAPYEPLDTVRTWHTTIQAVEEFINVPIFGIEMSNLSLGCWRRKCGHRYRSARFHSEEALPRPITWHFVGFRSPIDDVTDRLVPY
jgi:hypothetical protein